MRIPLWLSCNESACNAGDLGSIAGLGRSPGEEKGYPLQYSGLENSMDSIEHGVAKSRTHLSTFHFQFHPSRMDWFDLLAIQGILKSLLQHPFSKASILKCSTFFIVQLVAQLGKNPLAMWETWVWFLGWEDPLKKRKATHSSILAWRIPWTV